jgi:hypothetical protein
MSPGYPYLLACKDYARALYAGRAGADEPRLSASEDIKQCFGHIKE